MSAFISVDRLKDAVIRLCDWRGRVKRQSSAHVFPLLALVEKGANTSSFIRFEETDDYAFFDRYCKLTTEGGRPYFDPFSREFRIATHPHSNSATARKNTFYNRWKAAELNIDGEVSNWKLAPNFASIFAEKLFPKAGPVQRINVVDLAVWLFRDEEFNDGAGSQDLLDRFKSRFPFQNADFDELFEYQTETSSAIFVSEAPTKEQVNDAIKSLAFEDAATLSKVTISTSPSAEKCESVLEEDDPVLVEIKALLSLGTSGVILRGAPGTGKSWYADQVALAITGGNRNQVFRVQFHPSFTYEDFFDGYIPAEETKSGFQITGRVFRRAIEAAQSTSGYVVLIIDEINRGNTSKIFGEALTYIESGWRGVEFIPRLAADPISVPKNLLILATMNPHDRSITQLDMAMLRRFDHVDIPPSPEMVSEFLASAGMPPEHTTAIADWFIGLQQLLPFGLGHTFFLNVADIGRLSLIWRYRILPFCEQILEFEPQRLEDVRNSYEALQRRLRGTES